MYVFRFHLVLLHTTKLLHFFGKLSRVCTWSETEHYWILNVDKSWNYKRKYRRFTSIATLFNFFLTCMKKKRNDWWLPWLNLVVSIMSAVQLVSCWVHLCNFLVLQFRAETKELLRWIWHSTSSSITISTRCSWSLWCFRAWRWRIKVSHQFTYKTQQAYQKNILKNYIKRTFCPFRSFRAYLENM